MGLRVPGAFMLAALQVGLLAGCAEFSDSIGLTRPPDYAMATPAPVALPMPQPAPMAQDAPPPQGKFGVQIAAPRSVAEARALIDAMRVKYPNELGQQWATILPVSLPKGVFYRVLIGPLASEQQATQLCSSLRAQGNECFIRRT
jgi:cell division septation protein DedD